MSETSFLGSTFTSSPRDGSPSTSCVVCLSSDPSHEQLDKVILRDISFVTRARR